MKRTWTIIGVGDVAASFKWYQSLFGQPETRPTHDDFGQILDSDGTVLLCLHEWGAHDHPPLTSPDQGQPGNGLLLFFRVDDFDRALPRARALVSRLEEEPHVNPSTGTMEFSLRDPDGYYVTISALSDPSTGEAARSIASAQMLIRRPVAEVYSAFVDPRITEKFWFTRGDAVLKQGATVTWQWEMYGATADVQVIALDQNHRILIHWPTPVEWVFSPRGKQATLVTITASGFEGTPNEQASQAIDSMGGFSLVLAACKAWLEHGIQLSLTADHNPDHHIEGWNE